MIHHKIRTVLNAFVVLCITVLTVHSARATVVKLKDLKELAASAKMAGLFKVTSIDTVSVNNRHIFTRYYLRALVCYIGCEEGAQYFVDIPGGEKGNIGAKVAGAPRLEKRQNYVFILTKPDIPAPGYSIAGFNQGVFMKVFDSQTERSYLKPLALPYVVFNGRKVKRIPLDEFISLFRK